MSPTPTNPGRLRAAARVAVVAGALGSLGMMLLAGRNTPRFLLVLFVGWVLAPFVAIAGADRVSKGWPVLTRVALYQVSLVIAPVTLVIYLLRVLRPPESTGAFWFVIVPPASVLLTCVVVGVAALVARRRLRT